MQIVRVAQSLLPDDARGAVQQCIGGANPHRQVCDTKRGGVVVGDEVGEGVACVDGFWLSTSLATHALAVSCKADSMDFVGVSKG